MRRLLAALRRALAALDLQRPLTPEQAARWRDWP